MSKKKPVDLFGEDEVIKPESDFEALLNSSAVRTRSLSPGDRFSAEILAVTGHEAFVSTGTPTDAVMPFTPGPNGEIPKAGDRLEVIVIRAREGEILVKEVGGRGVAIETDSLEDAYDMELPVEGTVTESNKGGFKVKVQGVNAFCPISQMDWRVENPADYIGRKFEFIITKWDKGRDLVVSRRKILEQERAASEGDFQVRAKVGDIFTGEIFRIEKYGAFIRLPDGIEGLIPISELSFGRVTNTQDVVSLGQKAQVKLIAIKEDGDRLKLSFSLKDGGGIDDPWQVIATKYPVGTLIEGTVENREAFGLFVRLELGVTGLLPRSAWKDAVDGKEYENKRKGDAIKLRVARIDLDQRKLSLALPGEETDETWRAHSAAATTTGKSFGTLGDLLKGKVR